LVTQFQPTIRSGSATTSSSAVGGTFSVMVVSGPRSTQGPAKVVVSTGVMPTATMSISNDPIAATTRLGSDGTVTGPLSEGTCRVDGVDVAAGSASSSSFAQAVSRPPAARTARN
jgi:hypothetical protein